MTKKVINFKNKIFSKDDIFNIIKLFEKNNAAFELVVNEKEEKSTFTSLDTFKQNEKLDLKDITSFQVKSGASEDKQITLNLTQGNDIDHNNALTLEGKDDDWVKQTLSSFETLFATVKDQDSSAFKLKGLYSVLFLQTVSFVLLTGILAGFMYFIFFQPGEENTLVYKFLEKKHALSIVIYFCSVIPAFFFSLALKNRVMNLWPAIEFGFGINQNKKESARKNKIRMIIAVFLAPILVSLYITLFVS